MCMKQDWGSYGLLPGIRCLKHSRLLQALPRHCRGTGRRAPERPVLQAYCQQAWWSRMLRHAFQTALLHLNPPPKPSCQMRSPLLMLPVCSRLARMYLDNPDAFGACTLQLDLLHSLQPYCLESILHEAATSNASMVSAHPPGWLQPSSRSKDMVWVSVSSKRQIKTEGLTRIRSSDTMLQCTATMMWRAARSLAPGFAAGSAIGAMTATPARLTQQVMGAGQRTR